MQLERGMDFRKPEYRREVFLRFYEFQTRTGGHPGAVYALLPALVERLEKDSALYLALINGHTQNLVTSSLLYDAAAHQEGKNGMFRLFRTRYDDLDWDTDRRYHKKGFDRYWQEGKNGIFSWSTWEWLAEQGWDACWKAALSIPSFGRLSAWSFLEYLAILGLPIEPPSLMLYDRDGSRSHRNGLCIVLGLDAWDWHASNPGFDGRYPSWLITELEREGERLLAEARERFAGATRFNLESALCTYKSMHRPNRRYPNVYHDMMYERIRRYERRGYDMSMFWDMRRETLPRWFRLEENPYDPGCVPVKQNWYRETGEVVMMDCCWPEFQNGFAAKVAAREFGVRP